MNESTRYDVRFQNEIDDSSWGLCEQREVCRILPPQAHHFGSHQPILLVLMALNNNIIINNNRNNGDVKEKKEIIKFKISKTQKTKQFLENQFEFERFSDLFLLSFRKIEPFGRESCLFFLLPSLLRYRMTRR